MFTIKMLWTVILFLLSALIPSSWSSPVVAGMSHKNNLIVQRNANTCSSSWIQAAETRANKGPHQTISSLCSSLQSKYKTVTHSVYTKTVTPRTTVDIPTTAPRRTITATRTSELTQQSTDVEESTSVTDITATYTESTVVETDTVTVTGLPPTIVPRNQYPCQQIESLLTLPANSATPFCSCYNTGPTSTKTVTCDGATTAPAVHVTDHNTVTPSPSTAYTTVVQTTEVITTQESETVVTSTVSAEITVSVTDTVTATVSPSQALPTGYIQVQNPASPYNGYYAYLDVQPNGGSPIPLTPTESNAAVFNVDGSGYLYADGTNTAIINYYYDSNDQDENLFYLLTTSEIVEYPEIRPTCEVDPVTSQLSCSDSADPTDPRTVLQICLTDENTYGQLPLGTPFLVLDAGLDSGCELALLFLGPTGQ